MKVAVVRFPGSNCDQDCVHAINGIAGLDADFLWHKEESVAGFDAVVLPGGFSYGDYLRCGAIARFSPVMAAVTAFARVGGPVLGICNGFQILCEAGLLPGALVRNRDLHFICEHVNLRIEQTDTPFTRRCIANAPLRIPIAHGEGCYFADDATLREVEDSGRVVARYVNAAGEPTTDANPNGSRNNIAGICNESRNVVGLMPHPERACDPLLGSTDGLAMLTSLASTTS
jgi:phosphoribosylformylglycinamidine synthase subunit PurQ / glutaminase